MSIYLIDYENVNESGLEGVKSLKAEDQVHIFFSDQIKSIPFERSIELTQSHAQIEFIRTHKTAKNYLDFQLSTYLGYLIGKGEKGEVIVVSADKGFDSVVDFWKGRNVKISRFENIANKAVVKKTAAPKKSQTPQKSRAKNKEAEPQKKVEFTESWRKKVREAVKEDHLSPGNYSAVYKAIAESKDRLELNNRLVKNFDSTRGGAVYNHVKTIFDEFKKVLAI